MMSLIREKLFIKKRNLESIENDIDQVRTAMLNNEFLALDRYDISIREVRNDLESKLLFLSQEKREEENRLWSDVMPLKKDLIMLMRDYKLSMVKRKALSLNFSDDSYWKNDIPPTA